MVRGVPSSEKLLMVMLTQLEGGLRGYIGF
jgi:hypothetical protein